MSEPISFLTASGVVAAAAIPLILKIVPRVNRFAGWALLIAAAVSTSAFVLSPELGSGRSFLGLLIFLIPLMTALGASVVYLRKVTTTH